MGAASAAALDLHGGITTVLCGSAAAAIPMACHWLSLPAATLLNEEGQCVGTTKGRAPRREALRRLQVDMLCARVGAAGGAHHSPAYHVCGDGRCWGGSVVKSSQEHDRALVWRASGHVHCQISGLYLINREGSAAPSYR